MYEFTVGSTFVKNELLVCIIESITHISWDPTRVLTRGPISMYLQILSLLFFSYEIKNYL